MRLRVLARLLQIQRVLVRHGLDEFVREAHLLRPLRFAFYLSPATWFERSKGGSRGVRIREALEELGPIFMKFGQMLSTRRDLLPPDIAEELEKLQDRVPPFPGSEARGIVEAAYGRPLNEVFAEFDESPLAAATIAQVHAARLQGGEEVVVKVVRPRVREAIERDLELMHLIARLTLDYAPEGYRLRPVKSCASTRRRSSTSSTCCAKQPTPRSFAATSPGRRCFTCPRSTGTTPAERDGHGADPRPADQRHAGAAGARHRPASAGRNGVEIFFTQVFRAQLLPRRHAPRQHLHRHRRPGEPAVRRRRLRHRRIAHATRPALSRRELPRLLRPRLPPGRAAARRVRLGAGRHARRRIESRFARSASRSSTGRWPRFPSARCCYACSKPRGASR